MREDKIVSTAKSWAGKKMNWVSQSSQKSNLLAALEGTSPMPAAGFVPSDEWKLVCFEMPLLASLDAKAMTHWYTKKCIQNPGHYLKGHELRSYAHNNAKMGDLVFWSTKQTTNKFLRAFDRVESSAVEGPPFGLEHVALATGQSQNGESEVVSFWASDVVEITDVGTLTQTVTQEFQGMEFEVSVARGPWYWGYYLW